MREIIIKRMHLVNFKGLRDLTIDLPAKHCDISADNGLGKSTIFDAFTWVLFGKDRKDRTDFGLKTVDENNIVIPRIPHEVEITLTVDGEEVKLTRRYLEKWVKPKGSAEEEFAGHEKVQLYNDVPCSLNEWKSKISAICDEQVFKFITNPTYFTSQKDKVQRDMLFRMVGGVNDSEIAAGNVAFTRLLAQLTGKTMEDYRKEVAAKKTRVKKEHEKSINALEERRADIAEPEDWATLEAQLKDLRSRREELSLQLTDQRNAQTDYAARLSEAMRTLNETKSLISQREYTIREEVSADYRKQLSERAKLEDELKNLRSRLAFLTKDRQAQQGEADRCSNIRETLLAEYKRLFEEAAQLAHTRDNVQPQLNDADFKCPTCGHQYDIDRIEEIQSAAITHHRDKYAKLLADNADAIDENKRKGRLNNDRKNALLAKVEELDKSISEVTKRISEIEALPLYTATLQEPDAMPAINTDSKLKELHELQAKQEESISTLSSTTPGGNTSEITAQITTLNNEIDTINLRLAKRGEIDRNNARIAELESLIKSTAQELAELEGIEFTMLEFSKARVEAVENKINSLFTLVHFKMFDRQVNGQEVETCEATVNGVPFSDLNDAGRINAGLDIINAICKFEGINAPIFIDNAEGVNRPLMTDSQRIRLIVSREPEITVKASDLTTSLF
ncbi:MAG: AAA family ATPase [Prevotella sp.]|nr:AAA family ATPase [Lachnospiraceae bacterium]MCM1379527.1 AAA family ATPase [Bacteroides sp.]MCM1445870.1 AAA family ATPase [Prevotella sp.]